MDATDVGIVTDDAAASIKNWSTHHRCRRLPANADARPHAQRAESGAVHPKPNARARAHHERFAFDSRERPRRSARATDNFDCANPLPLRAGLALRRTFPPGRALPVIAT
jgi:hypothetical protein